MKKTSVLIYTFTNPNSPSSSEEALKTILVDRLLGDSTDSEHWITAG